MKKLFLMVPALLLAMFMVVSCNQGNDNFKLTDAQQKQYDTLIDQYAMTVEKAQANIPATEVEKKITQINEQLATTKAGFMIVDKMKGTELAKGTTKEALKARFGVAKA
ncbi:MAG: hypothetical protein ACTTKH_06975 [Treponema sp.]